MRARLTFPLVSAVLVLVLPTLGGCAQVLDTDFDAAIAKPTECDLLNPRAGDPRTSLRCDASSTCHVDTSGRAACVAQRLSLEEGAACTYANDCAPGLTCSPQLGCVALCEVGASCGDGSACIAFANAIMARGTSYGFCPPPSCDPLHGTALEGDLAPCPSSDCRFIGPTRTACFHDRRARKRTGGSCVDDRDCPTRDSCYQHVCARLCRVGGEDCGAGSTCAPGASDVGEPELAGHAYGHCRAK